MVRFTNAETEPGRRHSAGALGPGSGLKCLVVEFILVVFYLSYLRPWARKLYKKLRKADKKKLKLTSEGVTKKTKKKDGSFSVPYPQ